MPLETFGCVPGPFGGLVLKYWQINVSVFRCPCQNFRNPKWPCREKKTRFMGAQAGQKATGPPGLEVDAAYPGCAIWVRAGYKLLWEL